MQIRIIQSRDIQTVAHLLLDSFKKPPYNERVSLLAVQKSLRFFLRIGSGFVALADKKIVGVVYFKVEQYWEGPVVLIEDLAVQPEFQSQGVGKLLLDRVERLAKKHKACMVSFVTHSKSPAISFYKKMGYHPNSKRVIFEKRLR